MPILEECRDSDKIKITYQTWTSRGIKFSYPTDGTEDANSHAIGWKEVFIQNATGVKIEKDFNRGIYVIYGSTTSATTVENREGVYEGSPCKTVTFYEHHNTCNEVIGCNESLRWVKWINLATTSFLQGEPDTYNESDGNYYPASFFSLPLGGILVKSSAFNLRDFMVNKYTDIGEVGYGVKAKELFPGNLRVVRAKADCVPQPLSAIKDEFYIQPGSWTQEGIATVEEYWKVTATFDNGGERFVSVRSTKPIWSKVDPELNAPVEVELTKNSKYFDFELLDIGVGARFFRTSRYSGRQTQLLSIFSEYGAPNPIYSYSCAIEECPEGTWTLECGETTCCYNDQGYSTHQFPTP